VLPMMRFPVYPHTATPGITPSLLRKSYAYCSERVSAGTHAWLPDKKKGIIALPPLAELDDSLLPSFEDNGALDEVDAMHNGIGSADEKRAALRPDGKLTMQESLAIAKVRNYGVDKNPETGKLGPRQPAWADRVRWATAAEMAQLQETRLPCLKRAIRRGI